MTKKTITTTRDEYVVFCRKLNSAEYAPLFSLKASTKEEALNRFIEEKALFGKGHDRLDYNDYYVAHHQVITTTTDWEKV